MKRFLVVLTMGTVLCILFALWCASVSRAEPDPWLAAFEAEHGYAPDADPGLLALGMTPQEAMAEHVMAREWSLLLGHMPDMAEWMARWCQGHDCPVLFSDCSTVKSRVKCGFDGEHFDCVSIYDECTFVIPLWPSLPTWERESCWFGMTGRGCRGTYTGEWDDIPGMGR